MLEALQNIIAGIIAAIVMFFNPPLGAPVIAYDLLISSLHTEQEQCLQDTGRYCRKLETKIGNLTHRTNVFNNAEVYRSYEIKTSLNEVLNKISTQTIIKHRPDRTFDTVELRGFVEDKIASST